MVKVVNTINPPPLQRSLLPRSPADQNAPYYEKDMRNEKGKPAITLSKLEFVDRVPLPPKRRPA